MAVTTGGIQCGPTFATLAGISIRLDAVSWYSIFGLLGAPKKTSLVIKHLVWSVEEGSLPEVMSGSWGENVSVTGKFQALGKREDKN